MQLYSVHFSLQHMVSKYDAKGKKISEEVKLIEQTLTALPHSTALQYKDLPGFVMEPYQIDARSKSSGWKGETSATVSKRTSNKFDNKHASLHHAATTGDMSAAINAGA